MFTDFFPLSLFFNLPFPPSSFFLSFFLSFFFFLFFYTYKLQRLLWRLDLASVCRRTISRDFIKWISISSVPIVSRVIISPSLFRLESIFPDIGIWSCRSVYLIFLCFSGHRRKKKLQALILFPLYERGITDNVLRCKKFNAASR